LIHRFEHQHAGHDGKQREVIAQVILVGTQLSRGDDLLSGNEFEDAVQLAKSHGAVLGQWGGLSA
jgi:hypothetical protein